MKTPEGYARIAVHPTNGKVRIEEFWNIDGLLPIDPLHLAEDLAAQLDAPDTQVLVLFGHEDHGVFDILAHSVLQPDYRAAWRRYIEGIRPFATDRHLAWEVNAWETFYGASLETAGGRSDELAG